MDFRDFLSEFESLTLCIVPNETKTNFHELPSARHDNNHKQSIILFCQDQLTRFHPRADYRECLELALVVLGQGPENYVFKIPGA